ncbi:Rdl [Cordylochernes scorpioides]|uniref:Rdl n=1 Tax=Cordylochernes scorpioides TaxID=51811 RepID=A0ABY6JW00_9ARAC|nr:Rdl [Cordylochernes scorpioides]
MIGNYSRLICEIQLVRSMGYYLIQIYIPASLIVIISWVSFWLHRNATPARVALGVTTVLTMTTLMSSTNSQLPKISYVKSIDVYLGTCFVMVFASLLEYATVGYLGKRISMRQTRNKQLAKLAEQHRQRCNAAAAAAAASAADPGGGGAEHSEVTIVKTAEVRLKMTDTKAFTKSSSLENTVNGNPSEVETPFNKNLNKLFGVSPSDIDKYSRVIFPVCFVCFNLMYWIIYLHISSVLTEDFVQI